MHYRVRRFVHTHPSISLLSTFTNFHLISCMALCCVHCALFSIWRIDFTAAFAMQSLCIEFLNYYLGEDDPLMTLQKQSLHY